MLTCLQTLFLTYIVVTDVVVLAVGNTSCVLTHLDYCGTICCCTNVANLKEITNDTLEIIYIIVTYH